MLSASRFRRSVLTAYSKQTSLRSASGASHSGTVAGGQGRNSKLSIFRSKSHNPFFNIAFEQYLFNSSTDGRILYLWRNGPSVIIGRFQGAWKECNVKSMEDEKVNLVRRSSGGGAVYQDLGNSIFTFITPKIDSRGIAENNSIIVSALASLGIAAQPTGRNDIEVQGSKVSGAAFRHSRDRSLHHGTLLIDVDMTALGRYLTPNRLKMESKGVSSVAARVLNLKSIKPELNHDVFNEAMVASFLRHYDHRAPMEITEVDESFASTLPEVRKTMETLQDWEWRFGKEPEFSNHMETRFAWGIMDLYISAKAGRVEKVTVYSDALDTELVSAIQAGLLGATYSVEGMREALAKVRSHSAIAASPIAVANLDEFTEWVMKSL